MGQIGLCKLCRSKSDAAENGAWSGSSHFAIHIAIFWNIQMMFIRADNTPLKFIQKRKRLTVFVYFLKQWRVAIFPHRKKIFLGWKEVLWGSYRIMCWNISSCGKPPGLPLTSRLRKSQTSYPSNLEVPQENQGSHTFFPCYSGLPFL